MDAQTTPITAQELQTQLKQQFPQASDADIATAATMGLAFAQSHGEFISAMSGAAMSTAREMGFDASKLFRNYADCDSKAQMARDAAAAAAQAIPNPILKMAAVAAANASYSYAQGVCHRMYPNG
jgi:hypothetical protein